jgi:hypothetical protein
MDGHSGHHQSFRTPRTTAGGKVSSRTGLTKSFFPPPWLDSVPVDLPPARPIATEGVRSAARQLLRSLALQTPNKGTLVLPTPVTHIDVYLDAEAKRTVAALSA